MNASHEVGCCYPSKWMIDIIVPTSVKPNHCITSPVQGTTLVGINCVCLAAVSNDESLDSVILQGEKYQKLYINVADCEIDFGLMA